MHRKNRRAPFVVLISTALAPANVFGKYVSIYLDTPASNPTQRKTPAAESATGGILSAESPSNPSPPCAEPLPDRNAPFREAVVRLSPVTRRRKIPKCFHRAEGRAALARTLPRRENEERSSTATAGLLTHSVRDAFPTRKSVAKRESRTFAPPSGAGTYSSGNCSGFSPDSHLIPSGGTARRASGNRCRAKVAIFSIRATGAPLFFRRLRSAHAARGAGSAQKSGGPQ